METTTASVDDVYCLELARRAVARAALHLGIEAATQEVLDVVGDILLQYLQRVGSTLAHLVEASGRSTQHCHALDALHAIELCTSPAVARVHAGLQSGNVATAEEPSGDAVNNAAASNTLSQGGVGTGVEGNNGSSNAMANGHRQRHLHESLPNQAGNSNPSEMATHPPTSWQSLAQFSLGPNWHAKPVEADLIRQEEQGRGGKVGPSATTDSSNNEKMGWVAPFPEEIPPFPHASKRCANPHRLPESEILLYATPTPKISATTTTTQANTTATEKANANKAAAAGTATTTTTENTTATKASSTVLAIAKAEQTRMENYLNEIPEDVFTTREQPWGRIGAGPSQASDNPLLHDGKSNEQTAGGAKNDSINSSSGAMMVDDTNVAGKKRSLEQDTPSSAAENGKKGDGMDSSSDPPKKKAKLSSQSDDAAGQKGTKGNAESDKSDNAENSNGNVKLEETGQSMDAANLPSSFLSAATTAAGDAQSRPAYIPVFFPPIPRQHKGSRGLTVVDPTEEFAMMKETVLNSKDEGAATSKSVPFQLRSALVQLGSYWGSGWDADAEEGKMDPRENGKGMVHVPMGRVESGSQNNNNTAVIVPLGRASGSRVSRILEGSMDAANVQ